MARKDRPDETAKTGSGQASSAGGSDEDLERRRLRLEASLATRRPESRDGKDNPKSAGMTGVGAALKLSSEFIAGIAVGVGIGWVIDRWAGTSPWGLIVFLLLGFGAAVLNVLRSAGMVAEFGQGRKPPPDQGSRSGAGLRQRCRKARPWPSKGKSKWQPTRSIRSTSSRSQRIIPIEIGGLDLSFTNSALFMAATAIVAGAFLYLRDVEPRADPGAPAVARRDVLRVRRQHAARCRRHAGHAVLPVRVLAVHVRAGREPVRPVPLFLHRHQPHHRHLRAGASW